MDIPALVRQDLGDEDIIAGVSIGDEDVVCLTPTRTIVYRSEGLISDERVDVYPHEADRLKLSEGRRKSKFLLEYFDETRSLSVPSDHTRDVLTLLLEGLLGADDVIDDDESVVGAFRFSELTLIVAEKRLVRHIGATVWDDDYESYPYEQLTDVAFEEGSVATELVVSVDGRPQRIKLPRKDARLVEETVKTAVFAFYDVASFEELRRIVGIDEEDEPEEPTDDLTLGPDIDPLVSDEDDDVIEASIGESESGGTAEEAGVTGTDESSDDVPGTAGSDTGGARTASASVETGGRDADGEAVRAALAEADLASESEVELLREQVADLSTAVKRQNELLKKQHGAIKQLVEELRDR